MDARLLLLLAAALVIAAAPAAAMRQPIGSPRNMHRDSGAIPRLPVGNMPFGGPGPKLKFGPPWDEPKPRVAPKSPAAPVDGHWEPIPNPGQPRAPAPVLPPRFPPTPSTGGPVVPNPNPPTPPRPVIPTLPGPPLPPTQPFPPGVPSPQYPAPAVPGTTLPAAPPSAPFRPPQPPVQPPQSFPAPPRFDPPRIKLPAHHPEPAGPGLAGPILTLGALAFALASFAALRSCIAARSALKAGPAADDAGPASRSGTPLPDLSCLPAAEGRDGCAICFDAASAVPFVALACGHAFHGPCLARWLARRHACPLCRRPDAPAAAADETAPLLGAELV